MDAWIKLHTGEVVSVEEFLIRQLPVEEQAERRQQIAEAEAWAEELWLDREFPDGLMSEFENWEDIEPMDEEHND